VGKEMRRGEASPCSARQSGTQPALQSAPAASSTQRHSSFATTSELAIAQPAAAPAPCRAALARADPGPISSRQPMPAATSVSSASPKRTGSSACAAQYAGDVACASSIQLPVIDET